MHGLPCGPLPRVRGSTLTDALPSRGAEKKDPRPRAGSRRSTKHPHACHSLTARNVKPPGIRKRSSGLRFVLLSPAFPSAVHVLPADSGNRRAFRPRLQRRDRSGFAPLSLFPDSYSLVTGLIISPADRKSSPIFPFCPQRLSRNLAVVFWPFIRHCCFIRHSGLPAGRQASSPACRSRFVILQILPSALALSPASVILTAWEHFDDAVVCGLRIPASSAEGKVAVLGGALAVPCTCNPLQQGRIPLRGPRCSRGSGPPGVEGRIPCDGSPTNWVRAGRQQP